VYVGIGEDWGSGSCGFGNRGRENKIFTVESRDWEQRKGETGRSIPDTRIRGLTHSGFGGGYYTLKERVWGREDSR
jgi:hypothetical protein